jgi:hypothetical protein
MPVSQLHRSPPPTVGEIIRMTRLPYLITSALNGSMLLACASVDHLSMGLVEAVPERVVSDVMLQTIGFTDNRQTFANLFDGWSGALKSKHPSLSKDDWATFRTTMFGGDFLFNISEDAVAKCHIPLLVLMGTDIYHPEETSRRIAKLTPRATLIEHWKEPENHASTSAVINAFLAEHT